MFFGGGNKKNKEQEYKNEVQARMKMRNDIFFETDPNKQEKIMQNLMKEEDKKFAQYIKPPGFFDGQKEKERGLERELSFYFNILLNIKILIRRKNIGSAKSGFFYFLKKYKMDTLRQNYMNKEINKCFHPLDGATKASVLLNTFTLFKKYLDLLIASFFLAKELNDKQIINKILQEYVLYIEIMSQVTSVSFLFKPWLAFNLNKYYIKELYPTTALGLNETIINYFLENESTIVPNGNAFNKIKEIYINEFNSISFGNISVLKYTLGEFTSSIERITDSANCIKKSIDIIKSYGSNNTYGIDFTNLQIRLFLRQLNFLSFKKYILSEARNREDESKQTDDQLREVRNNLDKIEYKKFPVSKRFYKKVFYWNNKEDETEEEENKLKNNIHFNHKETVKEKHTENAIDLIENLSSNKIANMHEFNKFFVFFCGLSTYQILLLNKDHLNQSKKNPLSSIKVEGPIYFNDEFVLSLNSEQKNQLNEINELDIIKKEILIQSDGPIYFDNFKFYNWYEHVKSRNPKKKTDAGKYKRNIMNAENQRRQKFFREHEKEILILMEKLNELYVKKFPDESTDELSNEESFESFSKKAKLKYGNVIQEDKQRKGSIGGMYLNLEDKDRLKNKSAKTESPEAATTKEAFEKHFSEEEMNFIYKILEKLDPTYLKLTCKEGADFIFNNLMKRRYHV